MFVWFHGQEFELHVKDVVLGMYGVVSLIDTDVEVDIVDVMLVRDP